MSREASQNMRGDKRHIYGIKQKPNGLQPDDENGKLPERHLLPKSSFRR